MRPPPQENPSRARRGLRVASPQDLAAGLFLLAIAATGLIGSWELSFGQLGGVGAGMLPKAVSALLAAFGLALCGEGVVSRAGTPLTRPSIRGLLFVLGAALIFAWTIRPLGLVLAAPLTIVFAAFADREVRPVEITIFAVVLTAFSVLLFSFALNLPIPVLPSALPHPLNRLL